MAFKIIYNAPKSSKIVPKKDLFVQLIQRRFMIFFSLLRIQKYIKINCTIFHLLAQYVLAESPISKFLIWSNVCIFKHQIGTHSYIQHTLNWVYGFTKGLKIGRVGRDISVRGKAGKPQGKIYPLKNVKVGSIHQAERELRLLRAGGLFPLPI